MPMGKLGFESWPPQANLPELNVSKIKEMRMCNKSFYAAQLVRKISLKTTVDSLNLLTSSFVLLKCKTFSHHGILTSKLEIQLSLS